MFQSGKFYRHKNMKDVDIYVVTSAPTDIGAYLGVLYFNRFYNKLQTDSLDYIVVKNTDLNNWREV